MNSDAESSTSTNSKAKVPIPPANLRFQRRQSERAFVESNYRVGGTPTMEYPTGSSPWASSPDANRGSFGGDVPREDLPAPAVQHAGGSGSERESEVDGHGFNGPHTSGWAPDPPHQQWQQQAPPVEENKRPASGRYHSVQQPPQQRQHMPQYKLQAKLTGLERTGKKDPILRFDVHVCSGNAMNMARYMLTTTRPTSPSSGPHSFGTSAAHTPSSRSWLPTCRPQIPKLWSPPCRLRPAVRAWAPMRTRLAPRLQCSAG